MASQYSYSDELEYSTILRPSNGYFNYIYHNHTDSQTETMEN